jgi:hypothetical protein
MGTVARVDDVAGAAGYIDNSLDTQSHHLCKCILSAGWVFRDLVSWSRAFKNNYRFHPDEDYLGILVKPARKPKNVRDKIILSELMKTEGSS